MSTINKAYKIRIYPNKNQEILINKTFGCTRLIYNLMLDERIKTYEELKDNKEALKNHKFKTEKDYKEEYEFMKETDAVALQQARLDLTNGAFTNFFQSLKNKRESNKVGYPKFKSKKRSKKSYRTRNLNIDSENKCVKLPKLGWIKYRDNRNIEGTIKSATVSKTSTGKYFVSILTEQELESKEIKLSKESKVIGLDFSMSNFFIDSQGKEVNVNKHYRLNEKKLAKLQRRVSKKQKGSKNRHKAQLKVNKLHEDITNKRLDFLHKLSAEVVKENDVIVVEDLNMQAMSRCLNFGKSIHDLGWGMFTTQLEYKALWNNKIFLKADKWFASSQICSSCGFQNKEVKDLKIRKWTCEKCDTVHHRDINASKNLMNLGFDLIGLGRPEFKSVESKTSTF